MTRKCKNCGFVFELPRTEWRPRSLNPGRLYALAPEALYYPVEVCPRCGSDAIENLQ
ncbi:MAG: hypothetical protein JRD89_04460 [Deltaproteobacteria bacterium]|nr:hypothetical protein [Deltaproteobacteria bacterium]